MASHRPSVKWVDVSQPQHRRRRLINHPKLVQMWEKNPDSTDIFECNLIDRHYPQRPDEMEDICLYDFVAEYTKCGIDEDGNTVYRRLIKPVLPNHRLFYPSKENEWESYFYSLLLLFVPFRNESDLVEGETAESAFSRHMAEKNSMNTHSEKLQKMLKAKESVKTINEARQAHEEDITESKPVEDADNDCPQVAGESTSAMNNVVDLHQNNESEGPSLDELVISLNTDQLR